MGQEADWLRKELGSLSKDNTFLENIAHDYKKEMVRLALVRES